MRPKSLLVVFLVIALVFDVTGSIIAMSTTGGGGGPHDTTPLGTWMNIPDDSQCPQAIQTGGNPAPDGCEFLGQQQYYRPVMVVPNGNAVRSWIGLFISCVTPSNHLSTTLVLQVAGWDELTFTNDTTFKSFGPNIIIDGAGAGENDPACPGTGFSTFYQLPSQTTLCSDPEYTNAVCYVFRLVASNGGGINDNPRFSSATIAVGPTNALSQNTLLFSVYSRTTTSFAMIASTAFPVVTNYVVGIEWIANNSTITNPCCTQHGLKTSGICTITAGTTSCTANPAVTFPTAFTTIPDVVITNGHAFGGYSPSGTMALPMVSLDILRPQIVTV